MFGDGSGRGRPTKKKENPFFSGAQKEGERRGCDLGPCVVKR